MNRPDLSKAPKDLVQYIEHIESNLRMYTEHPLSDMYEAWVEKLSEVVTCVKLAKVTVVEEGEIPGLEDTGAIVKSADVDPFAKIKKVLSVMNEAKPTVETIDFLRQKIGIKDDNKNSRTNPIEDRAKKGSK